MAYCTVTELAEHLGLVDNITAGVVTVGPERTEKYQRAIDAASTMLDEDTGRRFTATEAGTVRYFVPNHLNVLRISDVVTVTEIKVDDDGDGTYETTLTTTDYELGSLHTDNSTWPYDRVQRISSTWPIPSPSGRQRLIKITGTWGWSSVPVPIKQACLISAARILQRGGSPLGVSGSVDFGAYMVRNTDPDYQALIAPYRKMGVA